MNNEKYIRRCITLARLGEYYVAPNPMVGAVLVCEDENGEHIIGEGWHKQYGGPHAEVNCFADAESCGVTDFSRCTLFVNLEPCSHYGKTPPCAELIIRKGVRKVVSGTLDPNPKVAGNGMKMLQAAGIEVEYGVLEDECRDLNKRFLCLHEKHRPYVILKWAQTADGFVDSLRPAEGATNSGLPNAENNFGETNGLSAQKPLVISNAITKQIVHKMRAENMAIMVGTNTVLKDNPRLLTTRWEGRNPIRITMDRHQRIPANARIFSDESETIVYRDNTSWTFMLADMAERGVHSLLVEGGPTLLQGIIDSGIYDEVHVEVAPVSIGNGVSAPVIKMPDTPSLVIEGHKLYEWHH